MWATLWPFDRTWHLQLGRQVGKLDMEVWRPCDAMLYVHPTPSAGNNTPRTLHNRIPLTAQKKRAWAMGRKLVMLPTCASGHRGAPEALRQTPMKDSRATAIQKYPEYACTHMRGTGEAPFNKT